MLPSVRVALALVSLHSNGSVTKTGMFVSITTFTHCCSRFPSDLKGRNYNIFVGPCSGLLGFVSRWPLGSGANRAHPHRSWAQDSVSKFLEYCFASIYWWLKRRGTWSLRLVFWLKGCVLGMWSGTTLSDNIALNLDPVNHVNPRNLRDGGLGEFWVTGITVDEVLTWPRLASLFMFSFPWGDQMASICSWVNMTH